MKELDYKLLRALDAVLQEQNFDRAAKSLHITQSAISQRIKQLEQQFAEPLLIRSQPLQATPLGQKLLAHYRQVHQLELELAGGLAPPPPPGGGEDRGPDLSARLPRGESLPAFFQPPVGKPGITVVLNARGHLVVGEPGGSDEDRRNERVE